MATTIRRPDRGIRRLVEKTAADAAPVDESAKAVGEALMADRPKARYLAGKGAKAAVALARDALGLCQGPGDLQGRRDARPGRALQVRAHPSGRSQPEDRS